jgi:hypothetical protein
MPLCSPQIPREPILSSYIRAVTKTGRYDEIAPDTRKRHTKLAVIRWDLITETHTHTISANALVFYSYL